MPSIPPPHHTAPHHTHIHIHTHTHTHTTPRHTTPHPHHTHTTPHHLTKVSTVPRGSAALGYAQYVPKERKLHTKEQMLDTMCMMLGGQVAERIFFTRVSTGAQDDLQKVTRLAYSLVTTYGMNDRVGHLSFPANQGGEMEATRPFSEKTAEAVDGEVRTLVKEAYSRTTALLMEKKELAGALAQLLLEKEVIQREDVEGVLGARPWQEATTFDERAAGVGNSNPEAMPSSAAAVGLDLHDHPTSPGQPPTKNAVL